VGEVRHLILPDSIVSEDGQVNLSMVHDAGISGLNSYYRIEKIASFPYARPEELPDTI